MKTPSSTQWFNIYSSASKYNIKVKTSRYKLAAFALLIILAALVSIITFTYHYNFALSLAVLSLLALGIFLSGENKSRCNRSLLINEQGEIQFLNANDSIPTNDSSTTLEKNTRLAEKNYQLLASSRFSFIGFWLVMIPQNRMPITDYNSTQIFIFRDSVSEQDFARLASVINKL